MAQILINLTFIIHSWAHSSKANVHSRLWRSALNSFARFFFSQQFFFVVVVKNIIRLIIFKLIIIPFANGWAEPTCISCSWHVDEWSLVDTEYFGTTVIPFPVSTALTNRIWVLPRSRTINSKPKQTNRMNGAAYLPRVSYLSIFFPSILHIIMSCVIFLNICATYYHFVEWQRNDENGVPWKRNVRGSRYNPVSHQMQIASSMKNWFRPFWSSPQ